MTAAAVGKRGVAIVPRGADVLDAAVLTVLTAIALLGFRLTYGGTGYLVVGVGALVFGIVLAHLVNRLHLPILAVAAVTIAAFFLLGGIASIGASSAVPSPGTVRSLGHTTVHGWMDLLTTVPPIGNAGHLLALPYLLGLFAGVFGYVAARRTTRVSLPLVPPTVVLVLGIVFGTQQPSALLAQGGAYAGVALLWSAIRRERNRPRRVTYSGPRNRRFAAGAVLVAVASAAGYVVGPHMPLAHANPRVVARAYVTPPFDPSAYPSPLAGFRKYVKKSVLYDATLMTVTGAAPGARVRVAAMTGYDGLVWGVTGAGLDAFEKVGSSLPGVPAGAPHSVQVVPTASYNDVWTPTLDATTAVSFAGPRSTAVTDAFRFDLDTATGVQPLRLAAGDVVDLSVVDRTVPKLTSGTTGGTPTVPADRLSWVTPTANLWAGTGADEWGKLQAIATHMHDQGRYSDGATQDEAQYRAGHSLGALRTFVARPQLVGNDEQYAATFALMANAIGVPARVVLGGVVEQDGSVKGRDMHAWIEVSISGSGWVPIYNDAFVPDTSKKPDAAQTPADSAAQHAQVPPPVAQRSKNDIDTPDDSDTKSDQRKDEKKTEIKPPIVPAAVRNILVYAVPPVALILALLALILLLKAVRRMRRRRRGAPSTRVAGGWADVLDCATDLGLEVPRASTRAEQATALGVEPIAPLAREADAAIFGPGDPADSDVQAYWQRVRAARRALRRSAPRRRRMRAVLTTRSLRAGRAARKSARRRAKATSR